MNQALDFLKRHKKTHKILRSLRDLKSVIVVEHDEDIIKAADLVIDIGPEAGIKEEN